MYILDEPSIGLHQRDNGRLLKTLAKLRDLGNTLIVVEHDEETMYAADHIIDMGPGPGIHGGLCDSGRGCRRNQEVREFPDRTLSQREKRRSLSLKREESQTTNGSK